VWCVAATLAFLRKTDPDLQAFYETHRPRELRAAKRPFNDDTWMRVVHPDEDRFIDAIFMLLGQFVAAAAAQQHQAVGLRRKERVDVSTDPAHPDARLALRRRDAGARDAPICSSRRASRRASRSSTCRRRACSRPRS
jgi:hypothetical protein